MNNRTLTQTDARKGEDLGVELFQLIVIDEQLFEVLNLIEGGDVDAAQVVELQIQLLDVDVREDVAVDRRDVVHGKVQGVPAHVVRQLGQKFQSDVVTTQL